MKSLLDFRKRKEQKGKISMLTCYDASFARLIESSQIDCILVGDSLAMTMHGHSDTLPATADLMALHVAAVRRGAPSKFLVGDMPFLEHRGSRDRLIESVQKIMRAGANAVKIEGADGHVEQLSYIVESGVPVMGHLGLTPQSVHQLGGYRVQGTDGVAAEHLLGQARQIEKAGCFALVLECIPATLAALITRELRIPTIGIGAGHEVDGQVLVLQDMLGMNPSFRPKFLRHYLQGAELMQSAFNQFSQDVKEGRFPNESESY